MTDKILIYIISPILAALLLWIGWLIKKQIDMKSAQQKQNEEFNMNMKKVSDCLDIMMGTMLAMTSTMKVSLQCHDVEFASLHNAGIINGESVEQRSNIAMEMEKLERVTEGIKEILKLHNIAYVNIADTQPKESA